MDLAWYPWLLKHIPSGHFDLPGGKTSPFYHPQPRVQATSFPPEAKEREKLWERNWRTETFLQENLLRIFCLSPRYWVVTKSRACAWKTFFVALLPIGSILPLYRVRSLILPLLFSGEDSRTVPGNRAYPIDVEFQLWVTRAVTENTGRKERENRGY